MLLWYDRIVETIIGNRTHSSLNPFPLGHQNPSPEPIPSFEPPPPSPKYMYSFLLNPFPLKTQNTLPPGGSGGGKRTETTKSDSFFGQERQFAKAGRERQFPLSRLALGNRLSRLKKLPLCSFCLSELLRLTWTAFVSLSLSLTHRKSHKNNLFY